MDKAIGDGWDPEIPGDVFDVMSREDKVVQEEPEAGKPEVDDYTPDAHDSYLGAEVILPRGGGLSKGTIIKRSRDQDLKPVELRHSNPILDTCEYKVEFEDGEVSTYQANLISEHLHAQCDEHDHLLQLMDVIIDHRSDGRAVKVDDGYIKGQNGTSRPRKTTAGWDMLVEWKDKTTS